MKQVGRYIISKNPVWTVPLALPIVLFASQSPEWAVLFGISVAIVVPTVHLISYFVESSLPRMLRIIPVLVIAGTVVTIVELFAIRIGVLIVRPSVPHVAGDQRIWHRDMADDSRSSTGAFR